MSFRVEVVCENAIGGEQRRTVIALEQRELAMETLGMTLSDGKALLAGVQDFIVSQQVHRDLGKRRLCPHCRERYTSKDSGTTPVATLFGRFELMNRLFRETRNWSFKCLEPKSSSTLKRRSTRS